MVADCPLYYSRWKTKGKKNKMQIASEMCKHRNLCVFVWVSSWHARKNLTFGMIDITRPFGFQKSVSARRWSTEPRAQSYRWFAWRAMEDDDKTEEPPENQELDEEETAGGEHELRGESRRNTRCCSAVILARYGHIRHQAPRTLTLPVEPIHPVNNISNHNWTPKWQSTLPFVGAGKDRLVIGSSKKNRLGVFVGTLRFCREGDVHFNSLFKQSARWVITIFRGTLSSGVHGEEIAVQICAGPAVGGWSSVAQGSYRPFTPKFTESILPTFFKGNVQVGYWELVV